MQREKSSPTGDRSRTEFGGHRKLKSNCSLILNQCDCLHWTWPGIATFALTTTSKGKVKAKKRRKKKKKEKKTNLELLLLELALSRHRIHQIARPMQLWRLYSPGSKRCTYTAQQQQRNERQQRRRQRRLVLRAIQFSRHPSHHKVAMKNHFSHSLAAHWIDPMLLMLAYWKKNERRFLPRSLRLLPSVRPSVGFSSCCSHNTKWNKVIK